MAGKGFGSWLLLKVQNSTQSLNLGILRRIKNKNDAWGKLMIKKKWNGVHTGKNYSVTHSQLFSLFKNKKFLSTKELCWLVKESESF